MQYLSDSEGKTTGVFIPIEEWNNLKEKLKSISQTVPEWQRSVVRERLASYSKNPDAHYLDFESALDEIEKDL